MLANTRGKRLPMLKNLYSRSNVVSSRVKRLREIVPGFQHAAFLNDGTAALAIFSDEEKAKQARGCVI